MCGAYNFNVVECALNHIKSQKEVPFISNVGICGAELMKSRGYEVDTDWLGASQKPSLYYARQIAEHLIELYNTDEIGEIYMVYTRYINAAVQKAECIKLLPLSTCTP